MGKKSGFVKDSDFEMLIIDMKKYIAKERNIEVKDVDNDEVEKEIRAFILDLQNYFNEDWEKKSKISIAGLENHPDKIKKCIKYLTERLNKRTNINKRQEAKKNRELSQQQTEEKWQKIEQDIDEAVVSGKQGTEMEILEQLIQNMKNKTSEYDLDNKERKTLMNRLKKRLNDAREEARKAEKERKEEQERIEREAEAKAKLEKTVQVAMIKVKEIVDREYDSKKIHSRASYLNAIRNAIKEENGQLSLDEKIGEEAKEQLLAKLDDEIYYEEAKEITDDLSFLLTPIDARNSTHGYKKRQKFSSMKNHERFQELVEKVKKTSYDEYKAINELISSEEIDDTDRRLLEDRLEVMNKEIEYKRETGEIR